MWDPIIKNMESKDRRERLEQAEDNIRALKEIVDELVERIKELEKKNDEQQKQKTHHYYLSTSGGNGVFIE